MIEINLVPDVKQELIHAQRVRTSVISIAVIAGIAAIAIVVLLASYVYGAQTLMSTLADNKIKEESSKLAAVPDISNTLTIQNQLATLSELQAKSQIDSRIFDILATINSPAPNAINANSVTLDAETRTITIEAQTVGGYPAAETYRKTIEGTTVQYSMDDTRQAVALASEVNLSDTSYGEDSEGRRVLRFTISFAYAEEALARTSNGLSIVGPNPSNVTDSYLRVPQSLFTDRARDTEEN